MRHYLATVFSFWLLGCGGADAPIVDHTPQPETQDADRAIDIVRTSFEAMGGIERLRLVGGKVSIRATATAAGKSLPVEITLGGPGKWRLDYLADAITFTYIDGICRKVVYEIPARCTPAEEAWMDPIRLLSGLVFPDSDAANLSASFRSEGEENVGGKTCDVVEIRPRNSNLRLKAMYDRESKLLAAASFAVRNQPDGTKSKWTVEWNDWREVENVKVPFIRTVKRGSEVIWEERAESIDFGFDERKFEPPIPTTTDQPLAGQMPPRRVIRRVIEGQSVEIPAPYATVGGGPHLGGEAVELPGLEVIRMVLKGGIKDAVRLKKSLKGGVIAAGREAAGEPGIVVLEEASSDDTPFLIVLYVPLVPKVEP